MREENTNLAGYAEEQATDRLKKLLDNLRRTTKHPGEPHHIHDLRVSIRRFTQALRVFKVLLDQDHYRKMRRKLRKVMDLCGEMRNCDVAVEVLDAAGVPPSAAVKNYLRKRRSRAEGDLSKLLERKHGTAKAWRGWLEVEGAVPKSNQNVASYAHRILARLVREFAAAGKRAVQPDSTPQDLHGLRLAAKRLRYSLEIFGPALESPMKQQIDEIRELQDRLGAINDCATILDLLADFDGDRAQPGQVDAVKALLDERVESFREYWREHYNSTTQVWWLRRLKLREPRPRKRRMD